MRWSAGIAGRSASGLTSILLLTCTMAPGCGDGDDEGLAPAETGSSAGSAGSAGSASGGGSTGSSGGAGGNTGGSGGVSGSAGSSAGGSADNGTADGGASDGGSADVGRADGSSVDGGGIDSRPIDNGSIDSGSIDGGSIDGGSGRCGDVTGSALVLDGIDDYVTMGTAPHLGLQRFTLETWFKRTGTGQSGSSGVGGVSGFPLITKGRNEADGDQRDCNYFFGIRSSDGVLAADFEDNAMGANHPIFGTTAIQSGVWYHGAATFDGSSWKLYLNGRLEATSSVTATPRYDTTQHFSIGTGLDSMGAPEGFFAGALDEVRVWDRARTEAEIQAEMTRPLVDGPGLVGRWGLEEGTGATTADSKGAAAATLRGGAAWTRPGSPFKLSSPPQPSLVAPALDVTVTTPVTLSATVADSDSPEHDVTFFGRKLTAAPDFTIATLPDTQYYSASYPQTYVQQTEWLMANRERLNIVYVAHMGDMVDNASTIAQWVNADNAMKVLESPQTNLPFGLPYCATVGNHDEAPNGNPLGTANYNTYFGVARFQGRSYYGGHYGNDNDNNYGLFSASGMDFIHVSLEYDTSPDAAIIAWADQLLKAHPNRRAIVSTHHMVNTGNPASFSGQGRAIYDGLKNNPNLFLLLGGHIAGEGRRSDVFEGRTIVSILQDYQGRVNGGDGWLRYYVFSPSRNRVDAFTYSPKLGTFESDDDSQFNFSYAMSSTTALDFAPIAALPSLKAGNTASVVWQGLAPNTKYEWYASANDCLAAAATPVRTFQTGP